MVVLGIEAVLAAVYAIFALGPRRGVFAALASDPEGVTRADATGSNTVNIVLFLAAGLGALAAIGLMIAWYVRVRRTNPAAPATLGLPWRIVTVVGFVAVVVALVLHMSSDPGQIAVGYVVLGLGALLIAVAAAWALPSVRRAGRDAAALAAASEHPATP